MIDTPCECTCHNGGPQAVCNVFGGCADLHHLHAAPEPATAMSRPTRACLLCPPPRTQAWRLADDGYRTCTDCYDRLRDLLKEVDRRWLQLDARPGAQGDHGTRGAPGFASRPAASPHIIAMRDSRSKGYEVAFDGVAYVFDPLADTTLEPGQYGPPAGAYVDKREVWYGHDGRAHSEQANPVRSVPGTLDSLASLIAEERDIAQPADRTVHGLTLWIDRHLDWITRNDVVTVVRDDLRELARQLRPVTGEPGRKSIGPCPNTIDDNAGSRECGSRLYAPLKGDTIVCDQCEREWPRSEWLRLGDLLESA